MQTTKSPKAGERTQNENEFPTVQGARMALVELENKISELLEEIKNNGSSEGVEGWNDNDNFGDFADSILSYDKEFLRKLVNLSLSL